MTLGGIHQRPLRVAANRGDSACREANVLCGSASRSHSPPSVQAEWKHRLGINPSRQRSVQPFLLLRRGCPECGGGLDQPSSGTTCPYNLDHIRMVSELAWE